jgi:hypothetical protein
MEGRLLWAEGLPLAIAGSFTRLTRLNQVVVGGAEAQTRGTSRPLNEAAPKSRTGL